MKWIRVGAAVLNQTPLDWDGNMANIRAALDQAREAEVSILCLPELCLTSYGCEDAFHAPELQDTAWDLLAELLPDTRGMVVSVGMPIHCRGTLFNAAAICVDGQLVGVVPKRHLAGDGIHYEPRWFKPWPASHRDILDLAGREVPIGDLHFDIGGVRIGLEICEDAWVADRPGAALSKRGVDIILNPSASHFAFGKFGVRRRFVVEGSRAFGVAYVYANLLGNESGRAIYDGGALIASEGRLVAAGPRFGFDDVHLTTADVDVDWTRQNRASSATFRADLRDAPGECVEHPFAYPEREPPHPEQDTWESWELSEQLEFEEFTRATTLALFDYLRKSRSRGFVVSLSGGADSAAVACLVGLMVHRACAEQGLDWLRRRLGYIDGLADATGPDEVVNTLLTTAYQPTRNSGDVTRDAAQAVADAVGATHYVLHVDALVEGYTKLVEEAFGRDLTWEQDNVTLQNIQARARAPSVWMMANATNSLLLATSNRSEAAVGYATMDGDTCGGLSPIAGIDKDFLRQWLRWLEADGPDGLAPLPALSAVNAQQPTAELRPPSANQTDEGDLMPYDLLDAIEGAAIRDKQMPVDVFRLMRPRFPQYAPAQLGAWVEKFFVLWSRNQWKRERYAPSFHLDDKNLDPRSWCRFPILSGGFRRELAALRAYVEGLA